MEKKFITNGWGVNNTEKYNSSVNLFNFRFLCARILLLKITIRSTIIVFDTWTVYAVARRLII